MIITVTKVTQSQSYQISLTYNQWVMGGMCTLNRKISNIMSCLGSVYEWENNTHSTSVFIVKKWTNSIRKGIDRVLIPFLI